EWPAAPHGTGQAPGGRDAPRGAQPDRGGGGARPPPAAPRPRRRRDPAGARPHDRDALMEIVLGMYRLTGPGGTEHYTLTAAEQLQRLGHEVTIFVEETGEMAELGRRRGLRLATSEDELRDTERVIKDACAATAISAAHVRT